MKAKFKVDDDVEMITDDYRYYRKSYAGHARKGQQGVVTEVRQEEGQWWTYSVRWKADGTLPPGRMHTLVDEDCLALVPGAPTEEELAAVRESILGTRTAPEPEPSLTYTQITEILDDFMRHIPVWGEAGEAHVDVTRADLHADLLDALNPNPKPRVPRRRKPPRVTPDA